MSAASRSMRRRLDGQARDLGPGPSQRRARAQDMPAAAADDNHACIAYRTSGLPPDARATIEPMPVGTNQSGRAHASRWRLRLAPRWRAKADPLTGWTGDGDPLAQIELRFATRDAAERYCRRERLPFEVRAPAATRRSVATCLTGEAPPRLCSSPTGPHALCCGVYPIGAQLSGPSKSGRGESFCVQFDGIDFGSPST